MFDWIKRSVKNAVLSGINEAIAELAGAHQQPAAQPEIRLCLPAPADEDEQPKKPRKAN